MKFGGPKVYWERKIEQGCARQNIKDEKGRLWVNEKAQCAKFLLCPGVDDGKSDRDFKARDSNGS